MSVNRFLQIGSAPLKRALDAHEGKLLMRADVQRYPQVFVLGPPRSGTTLLYQLIVQSLGVAYFCNFVDEHPRFAATLTRLLRSRMRSYQSDFRSNYGRTKSMAGPSEGLHIWRKWFPDSYVDESYLTESTRPVIQQTLAAISEALQASFVNKDPHHCVRVRALHSLFPDALFIVIERDPVATAESMLKIRRAAADRAEADIQTWMSVKPREYPALRDAGYIAQVCGQAYYCAKNAMDDLQAVSPDRFLVVSYEDLCNATWQTMENIANFLATRGAVIHWRGNVPKSLGTSAGVVIPESDRRAIRRCMQEIETHGI